MRTTCLAAASLALLGAAAPAAQASSVRVANGALRYVAGNESNQLQVLARPDGAGYVVIDPATRVRVGAGCTSTGRTSALCSGQIVRLSVTARGGDDVLDATYVDVPATLDGGDGDDVLRGGSGADLLDGDAGADTLAGNGGPDELRGDGGADRLDGGPGPDVLDGGADDDTADYSTAQFSVSVDLDGNADDGTPFEGDRVEADVERVIGSMFDDRLAAVSGDHTLVGGLGNDELSGGSGADRLDGGPGNDRLNGGVGDDVLLGGDGYDLGDYARRFDPVALDLRAGLAILDRGSGPRRVRETDNLYDVEAARGTSHADLLRGGPGPNLLLGGPGDDLLDGGPGADALVGGGGRDRADYSSRRAPVAVTLDGQPGDGAAGEGDNVDPSTEDVAGGARGDRLTGSARRNVLLGGGGRDELTGLGGGDTIDGGPGADRIDGGDGSDVLLGGPGLDLLLGGAGNDRAEARDGSRDGVDCGDGRDAVSADRRDRVNADCERVRR
jgi:Ca2+-binding RTX toxin-like protein